MLLYDSALLAADSDANVAIAQIKAIAKSWQTIIQKQTPIVEQCPGELAKDWEAIRLSADSTVSFDVKKTDSLISPYIGVISIAGTVDINANMDATDNAVIKSCSPTPEQALVNTEFKSPFGPSRLRKKAGW
jgi:hypothetical protein